MTFRLLKVVCQPVLVGEDDAGNLEEHPVEPITVKAADWPGFSDTLLARIADLNNGSAEHVVNQPGDRPRQDERQ
jgi:hypothetical protein